MASCKITLFNEPRNMKPNKNCNQWCAMIHQNIFHKLKYSNEWIYTVKDGDLTIYCSSLNYSIRYLIEGEGLIKINDMGCEIHTRSAIIIPDEELSTNMYANLIPKTDMLTLLYNLPNSILIAKIKQLGYTPGRKINKLSLGN